MQKAIIGKKVGMTQIFDESGKVIPVTVVEAGPCVVTQKKTVEKEGYAAVQLGFEAGVQPELELRGRLVTQLNQMSSHQDRLRRGISDSFCPSV